MRLGYGITKEVPGLRRLVAEAGRPDCEEGRDAMSVVRAALVQTDWTGDKESMIVKHEEYAREAAKQGTQVICFQ